MQTCPHCLQPIDAGAQVCPSCGVPIPTPLELQTNTLLKGDDYLIESVLGRGGFGITYLATDKRLGRQVAIKEFFPEGSTRNQSLVLAQNTNDFLETKQRFLEEARVLARFVHSGIVRVFDVFEDNNTAYLVMEALKGKTLGHALESGAIVAEDVQALARELCQTLEVVHNAGWLHRDIKPDNIFITADDRVVLIDFGSARMFQSKRTMRHTRLVTPGYAAPEQFASSAQFGAFTDIYGVAATLYHAVTGNQPPSATDRFVGTQVPNLPSDTPIGLRTAIEKGLALKVDERPQSAREFLEWMDQRSRPNRFQQPTPHQQQHQQAGTTNNPLIKKWSPYSRGALYMYITDDEVLFCVTPASKPYETYPKAEIANVTFHYKFLQPFAIMVYLCLIVLFGLGIVYGGQVSGYIVLGFFSLFFFVRIFENMEQPNYWVTLHLKTGGRIELISTNLFSLAREIFDRVKKISA